jgi:hypothetical protein
MPGNGSLIALSLTMAGAATSCGNFPLLTPPHGREATGTAALGTTASRGDCPLFTGVHRGKTARFAMERPAAFGRDSAPSLPAQGGEAARPAMERASAQRSDSALLLRIHRRKSPLTFAFRHPSVTAPAAWSSVGLVAV